MTKWHQKASVQTAIVSGVFLLVISLGGGLYSMYQENKKLSQELYKELNGVVINYANNANKATKAASLIELAPDFSTFDSTVLTMNHLNKEGETYDAGARLIEIHRFIQRYGTAETNEEFSRQINKYHDAHARINSYLFGVLKNNPGVNSVNEYVDLLNERSEARSNVASFIINLRDSDFDF